MLKVIFLSFWILFAWMALKAIRIGVLHDRHRLSGWIQLFLALLVFSLSGEQIERRFDEYFNNLPVAFYVKYFAMVLWFYLYYRLIRGVLPRIRHIDTLFWCVLLIGTFSIPPMIVIKERTLARHVMIGIRDFCLLVPTISLFIPATRLLADREHIIGMKTKQLAIVTCYSLSGLIALGNIIKAGLVFINPEVIPIIEMLFTPLLIPIAISFLCLLLSYHWLTALHIPLRLYQYWYLSTLEQYILERVGSNDKPQPFSFELLQMDVLELTIYRTIINIFDYGMLLENDPRYTHLYQVIQEASQLNHSYAQLVRKLATIRL